MVRLGSPGGAGARRAASQQPHQPGGEANLVLPDLAQVQFLGGIDGRTLLMGGLLVCAARARSSAS